MNNSKRNYKMSLLACACAFGAVACGAEDSGYAPEDFERVQQDIENGDKYPTLASKGVALLYIEILDNAGNRTGTWTRCSGQIISRDTILSAGHCFFNVGYKKTTNYNVYVAAHHQNSNGSWEALQPNGGNNAQTTTVYMPKAYVDSAPIVVSGDDFAVIRMSGNMSNVAQGDSVALHRESREFYGGYAYGYGYSTDSNLDGQLRRGYMSNLTYNSDDTITTSTSSKAAHICVFDSGGPLKLNVEESGMDGIQFGVNSFGSGNGNCFESSSGWAEVAPYIDWIKSKVKNYSSRCANKSYTRGGVKTVLCW